MKKIALIIGVNQYKDPEFKRLNAALNDAGVIEGIVRECLDFDEVVVERDPAEHKVRETLKRIKGKLSAGDLLLFYFAGHGFSTQHDQLLVMSDAEHDGLKHNIGIIPLSFVKERTYVPGVTRLCILDCCRSFLTEAHQRSVGAETYLFDSAGVRDLCRVRKKDVERVLDEDFTVLNACGDGEIAHEPKERGLFTQALSDVLRKMKNEEVAIQIGADSSFIQQLSATLKQLLISHHIQRPQTPSLFPDSLAHPITLYQPPQRPVPDWKKEKDTWLQASQHNTTESYSSFLEDYPESAYVGAAMVALATLERERLQKVPEEQPDPGSDKPPKWRTVWLWLPLVAAIAGAYSYWQQTPAVLWENNLALQSTPVSMIAEPESLPASESQELLITQLQESITAGIQGDQLTKPEGQSTYEAILALEALQPTSEFTTTREGIVTRSADKQRAAYEPTMVKIPAGRFQMGCVSGKNCSDYELPVHSVEVKSFYMSQTEITFAQWDACVVAGACKNKADDDKWGRYNHPVINVSWNDIKNEYLPWLNKVRTDKTIRGDYRLPTEAQWEYAVRAGSETQYSWGNSIDCSLVAYDGGESSACYYKPNGVYRGTQEVGQYAANGFGLYDMHGNVWEWTEDCWHRNYKGVPNKAERAWEGLDGGDCGRRIVRGGSWGDIPVDLRSASRYDGAPKFRNYSIGFRIVQPLNP